MDGIYLFGVSILVWSQSLLNSAVISSGLCCYASQQSSSILKDSSISISDFWRLTTRLIGLIVPRYSCYYLTRNSLTFAAPVMVADPALNMDITQVGAMTSVFPIFYGFSKFASGVLGARTAAHTLLGCGLMATALVNICFGFGSSLAWFCCFWALNGLLQVRACKIRVFGLSSWVPLFDSTSTWPRTSFTCRLVCPCSSYYW